MPRGDARPLRHRKRVEGRQRRHERPRRVRQARPLAEAIDRPVRCLRQFWLLTQPHFAERRTRPFGVQPVRDRSAGADARDHDPVGDQPLERLDRGGARDADIARQRAARGQPRTGRDRAGQDQVAQRHIELRRDRPRRGVVDRDGGQQGAAGLFHHVALPLPEIGIVRYPQWTFLENRFAGTLLPQRQRGAGRHR